MTRSFFDGLGKAVILAGLAWAAFIAASQPLFGWSL